MIPFTALPVLGMCQIHGVAPKAQQVSQPSVLVSNQQIDRSRRTVSPVGANVEKGEIRIAVMADATPSQNSVQFADEPIEKNVFSSTAVSENIENVDRGSFREDVTGITCDSGTDYISQPKASEVVNREDVTVTAMVSKIEEHTSPGTLTLSDKKEEIEQVKMGDATDVGRESTESGIVGVNEDSELSVQKDEPADQVHQNGSERTRKQLSKSALKQLAKRERYKEIKMERKTMEKEKRHQETARKRREWEEKLALLSEEERGKARLEQLNMRKERTDEQKSRKKRLLQALETGQNFVIDLEFSEFMKPNELTSLIQQVMYCYSANGKAAVPARISLTGVKGDVQKELDKISGYTNWLVHKEGRSYEEVFRERQSDLVYLTPDSDNMLESLDNSKIYIIGGLVDRNRWKNVTLDKATKQGIGTAKLPLGDHLKMVASKVLTVNQVMELLLCFLELGDWKKALMKVVPVRKRAAEEDTFKHSNEV